MSVSNEEWYDREIAPKLRELCDACKERKVSFLAMVEYDPGERGETRWLAGDVGLAMLMLAMQAHHGENIDGYVINLLRHANRNGIDISQSAVLARFGGTSDRVSAPTAPSDPSANSHT